MSATIMAKASRHSAILALASGLHLAAFVLVADGLLPRLLDTLPSPSFVFLLPPSPEPDVRLIPATPAPADYAPPQAPLPDFEIPRYFAALIPPATVPDAPGAPGGDTPAERRGLFESPALRMHDSRLMGLIDACYPAAARRLGEEGRAVAQVVVDPRGDVVSWSQSQGTGFPRLDAALGCVIRRLQFEPARRDGAAVTAEVRLPVTFRLN